MPEPCWCCGGPLCALCSAEFGECGHTSDELERRALALASPSERLRLREAILGFVAKAERKR